MSNDDATISLFGGGSRATVGLLVAFVGMLALSPIAATAAAPGLNFANDQTPNPRLEAGTVIIAEHDLGEMNGPLGVYDDEGEATTLRGATYNDTEQDPFGVRWDKVDAAYYDAFPRVDGETSNGATWTEASQWSASSGGTSSMAITDADASGVEKVNLDADVSTGETATAAFSGNVSLDDPNKRVLSTVLNVNTLASGATVELRVVDGDGDMRYAVIDTAENAADEDVIANSTGNGYVFQEKVGDLRLDNSSGDGTLDSIQSVEIVTLEANSDVTVAGLDVDKKSTTEFATIARDTDADGEDETVSFEDYWEGGVSPVTAYEFGPAFDDATIVDWQVEEVWFPFSEVTDESEFSVEFGESESSYAQELEIYVDLEAPGLIDVSYSSLALELEQGSIADRYVTLETATPADDTEIGGLDDADYTDRSGSLASKGDELTLKNGVAIDTEQRVHLTLALKDDEVSSIQQAISGGPTGSSGGFFSTLFGQIVGLLGAGAAAIGLGRVFGGGS